MDPLRILPSEAIPTLEACCRCEAQQRPWDRIAGKAYCPACEELLALGEAPPLIERTEPRPCAACSRSGIIRLVTFPLNNQTALELDLCPEHLRGLLGRRLGPHAYHQLRRQLRGLGFEVEQIFLLHEAFYDNNGRALLPVEVE